MPDTTHFVPKEPGYYFATHRLNSFRSVVSLQSDGVVFLLGHENFCPATEFFDWSPRITEPLPAPGAKEGDAIAILLRDYEAYEKADNRCKVHDIEVSTAEFLASFALNFPAVKAELEQLRGIVDAHANLELGDNLAIGSGWYAATGTNRYFVLHRGKVLDDSSFPSMRMVLAWLRSPDGKAAVAAAKGAS